MTDSADGSDPLGSLMRLAAGYRPGDTDFAWARITPWRSLLAAALDQPHDDITAVTIEAEADNPSAALLGGWLSVRLGVPAEVLTSHGPGITAVRMSIAGGEIAVTRPDGRVATLSRPGQPDRQVALHRRSTAELLAEELRRLDPDEVYHEAVQRFAKGLDASAAKPAPAGKPEEAGKPAKTEGKEVVTVPSVLVHRDQEVLAKAVAARLVTRLVDVQSARGGAHVVLTGGGVGTATLAEVAATPAHDAVDWDHLDIWWGDERFLPSGHEERNETGARRALLDRVPVDRAARARDARERPGRETPRTAPRATPRSCGRRPARTTTATVPSFDVLMLGVGPDGHVASLFPGMPALYENRPVVAVRGAPKPPPTRLTLTMPALRTAREVWIIAAGESKAKAVRAGPVGRGSRTGAGGGGPWAAAHAVPARPCGRPRSFRWGSAGWPLPEPLASGRPQERDHAPGVR